jgi:hypothetical protein
MLTMTRRRKPGAGRPKGPEPPREVIAAFRGTREFAEWFEGLVEHCRQESGWSTIPAATVIERALICVARDLGYDKPAPPR